MIDEIGEGHRSIIFISHANPEDNFFAGWLASRLSMAGYTVWVDLNELGGGEDIWSDIEGIIRRQSYKFIFVTSSSSIKKTGVLKELSVADKVQGIADFIIPVRIDSVSFADLPAEIIRLFAIDFANDWGRGLNNLLSKLQKDDVPRSKNSISDKNLDWMLLATGQ